MVKENNSLDNSLKLLVKTSFIVLISIVISKILGYVFRIIIARYYGPEAYGLYSLAFSITLFFIAISGFGFAEGLVRFIPGLIAKKKDDEIRYLFWKTIKFCLITGIIGATIQIGLSTFISVRLFHNSNLSILIKIMGLSIPPLLFLAIFLAVLRGFEKIGSYSFIYNIFQNIARIGFLLLFIFLGFRYRTDVIVWSFVLGSISTFFVSYIICRYQIKERFGNYKNKNYSNLKKEFFNYSWPIMFYSTLSFIFYAIDSLSLGYYKSAIEVGLYNTAVPIAALLTFIPELFMQLFFPLINREYSNQKKELIMKLSKQVTKWIFMVTLPIALLIFIFPGAVLNLIFGAKYLEAQTALRFLLVGSFISALFTVSNNLISMLGKSRLILYNLLITSTINLILNSVLIPKATIFSINNSNGLVGAALATLISIIFLNILFVFQTKKYLSFIPLKRKMIPIALISIIPMLILFYLRSKIAVTLGAIAILTLLFLLIYILLVLITSSLDENDWMIIKIIWKKISKKN